MDKVSGVRWQVDCGALQRTEEGMGHRKHDGTKNKIGSDGFWLYHNQTHRPEIGVSTFAKTTPAFTLTITPDN